MNPIGRGLLAVTDRSAVRRLFTETAAGQRLSHRFVAGETLDEGAGVAKELNAAGFRVSLDHLGEHVDSYAACFDARTDSGAHSRICSAQTRAAFSS